MHLHIFLPIASNIYDPDSLMPRLSVPAEKCLKWSTAIIVHHLQILTLHQCCKDIVAAFKTLFLQQISNHNIKPLLALNIALSAIEC